VRASLLKAFEALSFYDLIGGEDFLELVILAADQLV
jgi:hypothetical protein